MEYFASNTFIINTLQAKSFSKLLNTRTLLPNTPGVGVTPSLFQRGKIRHTIGASCILMQHSPQFCVPVGPIRSVAKELALTGFGLESARRWDSMRYLRSLFTLCLLSGTMLAATEPSKERACSSTSQGTTDSTLTTPLAVIRCRTS